jgi:tRNA U34 5-methylaminomethyl-2-thiouridine-forming methyltransferase MnmC
MIREIIVTEDGSHTIQIVDWNEQYHSIHGAKQEALHVYINTGFCALDLPKLRVLEIGYGTGLNCFLTYISAKEKGGVVEYTGIEAFPISIEEHSILNYCDEFDDESRAVYQAMYQAKFGDTTKLTDSFKLTKIESSFEDWQTPENQFDVIYYDAFGPPVQPELWTVEMFQKMYNGLETGGVLVTYCAKGQVKRNLKEVGFRVENLPGPPGKREITRAWKN